MVAVGRLGWIEVDCLDPSRLAVFWSEVLDVEVVEALEDPIQYQPLSPTIPGGPFIVFQRVPETKSGKNRLHFDIAVDEVESATSRIEVLGGSRLHGRDFVEDGYSWRVMADPEGNEFCLIFTEPNS